MKKKINIISPIFNEEHNINKFYQKLKIVSDKIQDKYEITLILVDDGSKDNSSEIIRKLVNEEKNIKGLFFTKNFGHQAAIFAGLREFDADYYAVLDADLQHNPELIELMIQNLESNKCEIIQMKKQNVNYEGLIQRYISRLFYYVFSKLTNIHLEPGSSDFFLITNKVRDQLIKSKLSNNFIRGFLHWTGFKKISISFTPEKRSAGKSNYGFSKRLELGLTGIYFYTSKLFIFILIFSLLTMLVALIFAIYIVFKFSTGDLDQNAGFSTITILILFFGSLSLFLNSILLFIINKIFEYSGNKPLYLKKKDHEQ